MEASSSSSSRKGKEEAEDGNSSSSTTTTYNSTKSGFRLADALRSSHLVWKSSCPTWGSQLEASRSRTAEEDEEENSIVVDRLATISETLSRSGILTEKTEKGACTLLEGQRRASRDSKVFCVSSLSQMVELDSAELAESILPHHQRQGGHSQAVQDGEVPSLEFMFSQAENIHPKSVDCWAAIPEKWMSWFERTTERKIEVHPHLISVLLQCQDSATLRRRHHSAYSTARLAQLILLTFDSFREQLSCTLPPLSVLRNIFKKHDRPDVRRVCRGLERPTNQFVLELLALMVYAELTVDQCPILSVFCDGAGYYALRIICDSLHAERLRVCAISQTYMDAVQEYFTEMAQLDETPFFPLIKKQLCGWKRICIYSAGACRPESRFHYKTLTEEVYKLFNSNNASVSFIVQKYFDDPVESQLPSSPTTTSPVSDEQQQVKRKREQNDKKTLPKRKTSRN